MAIAVDQAIQQRPLSFDEFLAHYGGDNRYELWIKPVLYPAVLHAS